MKKEPKNVVIYGKKVPIKRTDLIKDGVEGICKDTHIEIDKSLKGDEYTSTLLHEMIHYITHRIGINQTSLSHDMHELIAESISVCLTEVFHIEPKTKASISKLNNSRRSK